MIDQNITVEQARQIANQAAKQAVDELFMTLGIDTDNALETQKDMAFIRKQRMASEQISTWTRRAIVMALLTGLGTLLFTGIKDAITQWLK